MSKVPSEKPARAPRKRTTAAKPAAGTAVAVDCAGVNPDARRQMIEIAAYHLAEQRGFQGGSALDDWLKAEASIDRMLMPH